MVANIDALAVIEKLELGDFGYGRRQRLLDLPNDPNQISQKDQKDHWISYLTDKIEKKQILSYVLES